MKEINQKKGGIIMKVILKHKVTSFLILILLLFSFILFSSPRIRGILYPGDHINIHVTLFVDNQEIELDNLKVLLSKDGKKTKLISKDGNIKAPGKEYGEYCFQLIISSDMIANYDQDMIINLQYINANDWYISHSDCMVYLNTLKDGSIVGTSRVDLKYNDGSSNQYLQELMIINDEININWGL